MDWPHSQIGPPVGSPGMTHEDGAASPLSQISERAIDAQLFALENLVAARSPLTERVYRRLEQRSNYTVNQRRRLEHLTPWVHRIASPVPEPETAPGEIPFGIMNYQAADFTQASKNIGDWIQTIAVTSHILRRPDVTLAGNQEIVEVLQALRERIPPKNIIKGPTGTFKLVEFNRDASDYDAIPPKTWAFVFGWFMKTPFKKQAPFPLNNHIRPIFLSFHISRPDFLRPEVIDHLKSYGPVGCRDWHTTRLLTNAGIPAYFSGCVTTTIGSLFPDHQPNPTQQVAYVDVDVPDGATDAIRLTTLNNRLRNGSLATGLTAAVQRLDEYRGKFSQVVTSRLHTFLPCRSLKVPTVWNPKDPDDRRFGGLAGATAVPPEQMSARISEIIRVVLDAILEGHSEDAVYSIYRSEVERDVESTAAYLKNENL